MKDTKLLISSNGTIFLYLPNGQKRVIGTYRDGVFRTTQKHQGHYFKKYDGWGVCKAVVDSDNVEYVVFNISKNSYKVPKENVVNYSVVERVGGFEEQYIFPNHYLIKYKL
jgi:hypothetical protein